MTVNTTAIASCCAALPATPPASRPSSPATGSAQHDERQPRTAARSSPCRSNAAGSASGRCRFSARRWAGRRRWCLGSALRRSTPPSPLSFSTRARLRVAPSTASPVVSVAAGTASPGGSVDLVGPRDSAASAFQRKSLPRAMARIDSSRRATARRPRAAWLATSTGITTAPWRSACTRSPERTVMPATRTSRSPKPARCTWACDGPIMPASAWKPRAHCGMSRMLPSVTTPRHPSALWTALCTSPQNAPKPACSPSRSWITLMRGRRTRADIVVIGQTHGALGLRRPTGRGRGADRRRAGVADDRAAGPGTDTPAAGR